MITKKTIASLPAHPGVYLFQTGKNEILYVGKSVDLKARVASYLTKHSHLGPKTQKLLADSEKVDFILVDSEIEALLLESALIKKHLPPFNSQAKDDKHALFIRITRETWPRVLTARKDNWQKGDLFFGPFPSSQTVRSVLRVLRKIFPFCSCRSDRGEPCLYAHLGLCDPSPKAMVKLPPAEKEKQTKVYRHQIRLLVNFLKGKKKEVIASLKRAMAQLAKQEEFEKAERLKNQIQSLEYITQSFQSPAAYLENPNLLVDQRQEELVSLFKVLTKNGFNLKKTPHRLEAFDISNFAGQKTTGSMVTFINGEPEKDFYRRFRLKKEKRDDVAMMREVLKRRLNHPEWGWPDLILVDGGKPQVSTVSQFFKKEGIRLPLLGLAKKKEEIIFLKKGKFVSLLMPKDSPARLLLQRLRDEAHRFALVYHRHLRGQSLVSFKS